jgi:hypothetical protein
MVGGESKLSLGPPKVQLIKKRQRLNDRFQFVKSVGPATEDVQDKIDFGRRGPAEGGKSGDRMNHAARQPCGRDAPWLAEALAVESEGGCARPSN